MCASSELEDSNKSGPTAGHWSVQNQFCAQGTGVNIFAGNIILLTSKSTYVIWTPYIVCTLKSPFLSPNVLHKVICGVRISKGVLVAEILHVHFINKSIVVYRQNHTTTFYNLTYLNFVFVTARQPPVGQGLHIHEVSRSHSTTHHNR